MCFSNFPAPWRKVEVSQFESVFTFTLNTLAIKPPTRSELQSARHNRTHNRRSIAMSYNRQIKLNPQAPQLYLPQSLPSRTTIHQDSRLCRESLKSSQLLLIFTFLSWHSSPDPPSLPHSRSDGVLTQKAACLRPSVSSQMQNPRALHPFSHRPMLNYAPIYQET